MKILPPTPERIDRLRAISREQGGDVRVRRLRGSLRDAISVTLVQGDELSQVNGDMLRDILLLAGCISSTYVEPTNPDFRFCLNDGGRQCNVYFQED